MYEPEDEFEQELRDGLRLREAPEGFAERVIALAGAAEDGAADPVTRLGTRPMTRPMIRPGGWLGGGLSNPATSWAIAAALLITVALGGYAERQRQIAGERAREQVLLALRITGSTLRTVHDKVTGGDE